MYAGVRDPSRRRYLPVRRREYLHQDLEHALHQVPQARTGTVTASLSQLKRGRLKKTVHQKSGRTTLVRGATTISQTYGNE